jgi:hypothetical protein
VQQRDRRPIGHAAVAVGGTGDDTLEKPSTARISGTASSWATKCISEVPGFAKHVSTPDATSVRISACAPFIPSLL